MLKVTLAGNLIPAELIAAVDPDVLQQVMINVMASARAKWIKLAQERLTSTRRTYIDGIQQVEVDGAEIAVSLVGTLANLVEGGMAPFDMHKTLLGPQVPIVPAGSGLRGKHMRKDGGFWRVIPFKHQTPGSIGQGGGTPMGKPYEGVVEDAAALGKAIHKAAKKLAPTTSTPGGETEWGDALPEGLAPKLSEKHTTDIYAGMVRFEKKYGEKTQSTYGTFRIISDGQPDKWLHPGIEAVDLADDVHAYVEQLAPAAVMALLKGTDGDP